MATALAPEAATGFHDASQYEKHRPSYPPEAVDALLQHMDLRGKTGAKIMDLACGTGKFTDLLVAREEGFEVVGVEPHEEMRRVLVEKVEGVERVVVRDGSAENTGVEEGWADGVIAAQAFHWFATDKALKEINRVLKPRGTYGMIWNVEDYNAPASWACTTTFEQKLKDIIAATEDGVPRFRHLKWKDVFENQLDTNPLQTLVDTFTHNLPSFSLPLGEETVKWTVWMSEIGVWQRFATLSQIAVLAESKKESVKREVFEAMKDSERNEKGEIALHGVTHLVWTSRV